MLNSAHRLRQRLHQTALDLAEKRSLPSVRHAEALVLQILREEDAGLPADETIRSLAEELRRIVSFRPRPRYTFTPRDR